jgi:hypothetical protein
MSTDHSAIWTPWKTIVLGTDIQNGESLCDAIAHNRHTIMRIGKWAYVSLNNPKFPIAKELTKIDLVIASVAELGFQNKAKLCDIYATAQKKGLQLCPNECGPQLRLQYLNQPKEEKLVIGMEPITISVTNVVLFCVRRTIYGLTLCTEDGNLIDFYLPDSQFVFMLPGK